MKVREWESVQAWLTILTIMIFISAKIWASFLSDDPFSDGQWCSKTRKVRSLTGSPSVQAVKLRCFFFRASHVTNCHRSKQLHGFSQCTYYTKMGYFLINSLNILPIDFWDLNCNSLKFSSSFTINIFRVFGWLNSIGEKCTFYKIFSCKSPFQKFHIIILLNSK